LVLAALTLLFVWLCYRLAEPFLPALAWGLALAVVAHPLHAWVARRVAKPGLAAGLAVTLVAVAIIAPAAWVGHEIAGEVKRVIELVQSGEAQQRWEEAVRKHPSLAPVHEWTKQLGKEQQPLNANLNDVRQLIAGSVGVVIQLLVTFLFLFFLFRDRHKALRTARSLVPLSEREADEVFKRVGDTLHASIYGTLR
jgi:predicted PurR-regulated permease PerM